MILFAKARSRGVADWSSDSEIPQPRSGKHAVASSTGICHRKTILGNKEYVISRVYVLTDHSYSALVVHLEGDNSIAREPRASEQMTALSPRKETF